MSLTEPFFILGNPRSGTSLFRLILNSHPNILVPPECGFVQWWYDKYHAWTDRDNLDEEKVGQFIKDLSTSKKIEDWHLDFSELKEHIICFRPSSYGDLCQLVYRAYSNKKAKIIGDKNNYFIQHIDLLKKVYPQSKFIHLIRDGRDVACSYLELNSRQFESPYAPKLPGVIVQIAREWQLNVDLIEKQVLNSENITVRYEDLITNPEKTLVDVCGFLEVTYSDEMLKYHEEGRYDEPLSTREWKSKTQEAVDSNNANKYLKILSSGEIEIFKREAGDTLKRFGYE